MMWDDNDGRWGMHDQAGGAGWFMVILMLAVVFAAVVVVVVLLRGATPLTASPTPRAVGGPDARAVLRERLARGEIDEQDFRSRMRALDESDPAGG